ncbi:MAG: hypothetical protein PHG97_01415 [Candidatus Margulisbacteria bacterium]|nr:hypothetical protein [Candidatus Margulisiibacteriota bacterium]
MKLKIMGVGIFLVLCFCSSSWATITVNINTSDKAGNPATGLVEVIDVAGKGSPLTVYTDNTAPDWIKNGKLQTSFNSDAKGFYSFYEKRTTDGTGGDPTYIRLRAWNGAKALNSYYGYSSNLYIRTAQEGPDTVAAAVKMEYKAAPPFAPAINYVKQSDTTEQQIQPLLQTGTNLKNVIFNFSDGSTDGVDKVEITGSNSHPNKYKLLISNSAGFANSQVINTDSTTVTVDRTKAPFNTFFNTTDSYYTKAVAYNYFGDGGVEGPAAGPFMLVSGLGGGGGAPAEVAYTLVKKTDGNMLGVNSIGIPFNAPFTYDDGKNPPVKITYLSELINAIGASGVTATAYWDNNTQQLTGATYVNGAIGFTTTGFDPSKVQLEAGKGYYLSVSSTVSFKLRTP